MVMHLLAIHMKRVLVVGAGILGLVTAVREHLDGNQVFILEKRKRIGGRGTSEESHGHQLEFGPHLLLKGGELHSMVKKVSRIKPSLRPLRANKIFIVGHGMLQPLNNPKQMLNIIGEQSMLQITVDRLNKLKSTSEIYIITKKELYTPIIKTIKDIEKKLTEDSIKRRTRRMPQTSFLKPLPKQ